MSGIAYDVSWLGQRPGLLSMADQMTGCVCSQRNAARDKTHRQLNRTTLNDEDGLIVAAVKDRLKEVKIAPRSYLKYRAAFLERGDQTVKELSLQLSLYRQAVVLILDKMEEAGFVRRIGVEGRGRGKEFVWHWIG